MGMIDQKTVKWQELPDVDYNEIQFKYDERSLKLKNVKFDNAVVTGNLQCIIKSRLNYLNFRTSIWIL